jgi:hypothetical protein
MIMMVKKIYLLPILWIFLSGFIYSQNKTEFSNNYKVLHYLLKDSSSSYIIKEVINSDGTRAYGLIPKSYIEDIDVIKDNYPSSLIEWFNKEKKSGKIAGTSDAENRKKGIIDTVGVTKDKKNKTIWWILGTTAVIGGITAYYFLQVKNNLDELPIQPNPPK